MTGSSTERARDLAWAALFDPSTSAASLAQIALAFCRENPPPGGPLS